MIIKPAFLFLMMLFAGSCFAWGNFSGMWSGAGVLTHSTGKKEICQMQIAIENTTEIFLVRESLFDCETMKIRNKAAIPLKILNGELWWDQLLLGTLTSNFVETRMTSVDGRVNNYILQITEDSRATQMNYFDHIDWTTSYATSIVGQLKRTQ